MAELRLCSVPNCGKRTVARGYCGTHWKRWRTHGDPLTGGDVKERKGEPFAFLSSLVETHPAEDAGCVIWPFGRMASGYGQLTRGGKKLYAHRLVCELVHGPAPSPDHAAAHSCGYGKTGCVSPNHLRWATRAENAQEYVAHQTQRVGQMPSATIPPDDVHAIRALASILPQQRVASLFGISQSTVHLIQRRKIWRWL